MPHVITAAEDMVTARLTELQQAPLDKVVEQYPACDEVAQLIQAVVARLGSIDWTSVPKASQRQLLNKLNAVKMLVDETARGNGSCV